MNQDSQRPITVFTNSVDLTVKILFHEVRVVIGEKQQLSDPTLIGLSLPLGEASVRTISETGHNSLKTGKSKS